MKFEDLYEGLERILTETERLTGWTEKNAGELGLVVRYAAEIRSALNELRELMNGTGQSKEQTAMLASLASRFWALEGRIKELRNDSERRALARKKQSTCL